MTKVRHIRAAAWGITCLGLALLASACGESSDPTVDPTEVGKSDGGGAGGEPGGESATTSGHVPLALDGDWVDVAGDSLGIRGYFSTGIDNSGQFNEEPELEIDVNGDREKLCVSGNTGWADDSLAGSFAAELSLTLNQLENGESQDYDAASHGVVGFSFVIDAVPPGGLRFQVMDSAVTWRCAGIDEAGRHDVLFEDLEQCSALDEPLHLDRLSSLQWQFAWPGGDPLPISMCLSELAAIVR